MNPKIFLWLIFTPIFLITCIGHPSEKEIKAAWQQVINSKTAQEEYKNIEQFYLKYLKKDLIFVVEIKDNDGNTHPYNPYDTTKIELLPDQSFSLTLYDGNKWFCTLDFWTPKNRDNFFILFRE